MNIWIYHQEKQGFLRVKKKIFSPHVVAETIKPRRPFTRSASKQHVPMEYGAK